MRKVGFCLFSLLIMVIGFGAEVSKRKEIAVMPVYSSYNLPSSAYMYFDDRMIATLASMRRFQVIGYQYRLDGTTAQRFIERIRELKKELALQNPQYKDEDLGIAVIPAAEMRRLVDSVFVFIPSINGYDSRSYNVEIKQPKKDGGYEIKIVREYSATVNISVKIIDTVGNLLSTYDASGSKVSRVSANDAYQKAVDEAVNGFGYYLRNIDEFKIKTGILRVEGSYAYLELGKNMGINPGYEFVVEEEVLLMDRFKEKRRTGLIRVSYVSDEYSYGHVIFGNPKPGAQLIEAPKSGGRFGLSVGAMPLQVPSKATLVYRDTSFAFTNTLSLGSVGGIAPSVWMHFGFEMGYDWLWEMGLGVGFASPLMLYLHIGPAYEWYMRNMSLVLGTRFAIHVGTIDVGKIDVDPWESVTVKGKVFDDDVNVSVNWFDFGLQPYLAWNFQLNQTVKFRLFGGFQWGFYQVGSLFFREDSTAESAESISVDPTFLDWDGKLKTTGFFAGVEFIFRL